jgi:hypothetical protein
VHKGRQEAEVHDKGRVRSSEVHTAAAAATKATLSRNGHLLATGTARTVNGHIEFLSSNPRVLSRGLYTLTITHKAGRHITTTHQAITIT